MKYLLYIMSNMMAVFAALMEIRSEMRKRKKNAASKRGNFLYNIGATPPAAYHYEDPEDKDDINLPVSFDLRVMCLVGSIARVFWSDVPPVAWHRECYLVQAISILDVHISPFVWAAMVYIGYKKRNSEVHKRHQKAIRNYFKWPALVGASMVIAFFCQRGLLPKRRGSVGQDLAELMIIFNNIVEALAMVPQIVLVRNISFEQREAQNFIGCLCVSRILRLAFWAATCAKTLTLANGSILRIITHGRLICYMVPDIVHSFFLMGFLQGWTAKMAAEQLEKARAFRAGMLDI